MPTPQTRSEVNRAILRSQVVLDPLGVWTGGMFGLGLLLLPLAVLKASAGNWPRAIVAGLLGVVLLLLTWRRVARRNRPHLLTSGPDDALHLEPLGRSRAQGQPAEIIPLASIKAYRHWLRLLRFRAFAQYHLRLELVDGRVLHLADQPSPHPNEPSGTVRLDAIAKRLARRAKSGLRRRLPFYETQLARLLLWVSWAVLALGAVLFWLGYDAGLLLLLLGASYWSSYYLGRDSDAGSS